MAGDWIKMEVALPDKPEVWQIAGMLSIEPDSVVGKLLRVWAWFDAHTENGVSKSQKLIVDRQAGLPGFADAMVEVGWLVVTDQTIEVPQFSRHNGRSAKSRVATNERVAKHRAKVGASGNANETSRVLPRPIVRAVRERDNNACVYCGRPEGEFTPPETSRDAALHIDHVIPKSRGGSDEVSNLACACGACNLFKLDRTPDECGLDWPEVGGKRLGNTSNVTDTVTKSVSREEKRREEYSVAKATGATAPPPTPQERVWAFGLPLLTAASVTEKNARSMLGGLVKRHGADAVADAIDRCAKESPVEPVGWLQAVLQANGTRREGSGKPQGRRDIFAGLEQ